MEKTINVKGYGEISIKPDLMVVDFELSKVEKEYEQTVLKSKEHHELIKKIINDVGLDINDLKTKGFIISPEEVWENNKSIRVGYRYSHNLYIEFPINDELLSKILSKLAKDGDDTRVNFRFGLKDIKGLKEKAITLAIEDGNYQAQIIAKAAKVELKEIININYGNNAYPVYPMNKVAYSMDTGNDGINPDELKVSEEVYMTYAIK